MSKNWTLQTLPPFYFGKIGKKKVFGDIPEEKKVISRLKRRSKKTKKWLLSKGVSSWFWPKKMDVFHVFVFGRIGKKNVFSDILKRKKKLSRL